MKIKRLSWKNYKGVADGEICADGSDVIISGRNGAGKSTIAEMLTFVLSGKVTGSLKRYDEQGLKMRDGLIHGARIEFEDGTILQRGISDAANGGSKSILNVNGEMVPARKYDSYVEKVTNGGVELVLNPFAFVKLASRQQRNLLLKMFGAASSGEIPNAPEQFGGLTAETYIAQCKAELRNPKAEAMGIPSRIDELERQTAQLPADVTAAIKRFEEEIAVKQLELEKYSHTSLPARTEYEAAQSRLDTLEREKKFTLRRLESERAEREKLLAEYKKVKTSTASRCPTCGQAIPLEQFEAKRDERMLEIISAGKIVAAQIGELEKELADTTAELSEATAHVQSLKSRVDAEENEKNQRVERYKEIHAEISALQLKLTEVKTAARNVERITELKAREKKLNQRITELEGQIALAEDYQQERIRALEAAINGHFAHVRFKLFDMLIDGSARETCEAMLDGVPYSALSKGEKLKAALDIFTAIQKYYGVEMPLIIDDAESYTANSFVELPNQKFYFRVTESDLAIRVMEGRQAA